ncbi:mRNA 3' end processing factor [Cichlidogyrus casuarinus]|uniref:mRNA 3' end processing factor n=1 Tax=Cichlidogyrus casuarinus TaxID=1844966 RepID=A0ABD2Q0F5_9PLAT
MVEPQKLVQQFVNDLSTLRSSDKFKIGALTLFASDHKESPEVVRGIIQACCDNVINLPSLYVIDSIVKNYPEPYAPHFSKRIADLFFDAFQKSRDVDIRKKLYKLRITWNDFFNLKDLYQLDVKVRSEDVNWPVLIQEPSSKNTKSLSNVQKIPKKRGLLDTSPAAPPPDSTPPTVEDVIVTAERDPRRKMRPDTVAREKDDIFLIDRAGDQAMESVANQMGQSEFESQRKLAEVNSPRDVDMRLSRQPFEPPTQPERPPQYHHPPYSRLPRLPPPVLHGPPISGPDWNVEIPDFPDMVPIGVDPRMLSLTRNPKADKTIQIDSIPYPLLLDRIQPLIRVDDTVHAVRFRCQSVNVMIDDRKYTVPGTGFKMINMYSGKALVYLGGPGHELVLDGIPHTVPMNSSVTYINHKNRSLAVKFIGQVPSNVNVLPAIPAQFLKWAAMGLFGNPQQLVKPAKNPLVGLEQMNDPNNKERPANTEEVDIQDLFSRLVANGIVQKYPDKKSHDHPETRKLPDLQKYLKEDFSVPYIPEIEALFDGYQCVSCGLRFSSENSPAYANHLDYHYIKKSHDNEDAVKNHNWYQNSSFWLLGENSHDNQATEFEASVIEQREVKKCPAFSDPLKNVGFAS